MSETLVTLIGLWVLLAALWMAFYPFLSGSRTAPTTEDARRTELETEKARLIEEIHELRLDLETGKLAPDDHAEIERRLKSRAVAVMKELSAEPTEGRSSA